jgi:hypothetical protein
MSPLVLEGIGPRSSDDLHFICTKSQIQQRIVNRYLAFMEKHNYRRPGGGGSTQAILNLKGMEDFEDNWEILNEVQ